MHPFRSGDMPGRESAAGTCRGARPNIRRMRDGKAVEHWSEQGMLAMLQQLGVVPQMGAPQPAR